MFEEFDEAVFGLHIMDYMQSMHKKCGLIPNPIT
jgi:hypothetical protein